MNPKYLYIRIITQDGAIISSNNYAVKCRQDRPMTDKDAEAALRDVVNALQRKLPESATILKAEFVSQQTFELLIRDADKVVPWRTLDFVVQSLAYDFEESQNIPETKPVGHPVFTPQALIRVLVDESPSLMTLEERERIRAMVASYLWNMNEFPIYSLSQIEPDAYWNCMRMIRESKNKNVFLKILTKAELEAFWEKQEAEHAAGKQDKEGKGEDNAVALEKGNT